MLSGTAQPPALVNGGFPTESVNGFPNGTAALPSIFFAFARNTGFYLTGGGFVGISQGGVGAFQIYRSGGISSILQNPNGSAAYIEISDTGTVGIVPAVGNTFTVSNGVARFVDGSAASPAVSFTNDPDCGLYRVTNNTIGFSAGGGVVGGFDLGGIYGGAGSTGCGAIASAVGTAAAPAFTFKGNTNLGIWRSAADEMAFVSGGVSRVFVNSNGLNVSSGTIGLVLSAGRILRLGNNYVAVAPGAATGTVTIQDGTGTTYRVPVLV